MLLGSSIWLLALAAIGIPVVIHLWNIKPGKTLKVGSIALFSESSPKSSRSFKLQDVLLLAVRCLMLALLAFLLAAPYLQQQLKDNRAKGWVLIPEANLLQTYHHFQPRIDSLTKAGYEFHYFGPGFKKDDLTELLKTLKDSTARTDSSNYWTLSRHLSHKAPTILPIELFTSNTAAHFAGNKPETQLNINWHTYQPTDSISTGIAGAWLTSNGEIRVVQGTATPSGTAYQFNNIKNGSTNTAYNMSVENGVPEISLKNSPDQKVKVDTVTKRIAIYADRNAADANYLKAALEAISQLTHQKTIIKQYSDTGAIPSGQDWLFWLSDKPVATGIAKNVFQYESGKSVELQSLLSNANNLTVQQSSPQIPLYKIIKSKPIGETLWSDGLGDAVLSLEVGKANTYHFYSHFNPTWSDLVWSDEFPKWLMELTNNLPFKAAKDNRSISAEQLQPVHIDAKDRTFSPQTERFSLVNYLWIALALVFFIERWLATKNNTVIANG